uniref:Uncharacterized protein n=1 Tax=Oryza rufipogon TaxID=4529 RepID=A0A0E0QR00_ORYRU
MWTHCQPLPILFLLSLSSLLVFSTDFYSLSEPYRLLRRNHRHSFFSQSTCRRDPFPTQRSRRRDPFPSQSLTPPRASHLPRVSSGLSPASSLQAAMHGAPWRQRRFWPPASSISPLFPLRLRDHRRRRIPSHPPCRDGHEEDFILGRGFDEHGGCAVLQVGKLFFLPLLLPRKLNLCRDDRPIIVESLRGGRACLAGPRQSTSVPRRYGEDGIKALPQRIH